MLLIINAINLIDGVDGLAVTLSIIAFSCFIIIEAPKDKNLYLLLFIIVGSLIGLLKYNLPEAKIFLGDNGSLTLGFLLASLSMVISSKTLLTYSIFLPITTILIPIIDVFFVSLKRIKQRKSIFSADKNHIHHELLALGFTKRQVLMILSLITSLFSIVSLFYNQIVLFCFFAAVIVLINIGIIILRYFDFKNFNLHIKKYNKIFRLAVKKIVSKEKSNFTFNLLLILSIFLLIFYVLSKISWNYNFIFHYSIFFMIFVFNNLFDFKDDITKIFSNFIIFWFYLFISYEFYILNPHFFEKIVFLFAFLNLIKIYIEKKFELFLYNPTELIIIHLVVILFFNHIINFKILLMTFLIYNLGKNFMSKNTREFKIFYPLLITISILTPLIKIVK